MTQSDTAARTRWTMYTLLFAIAAGGMAARIMSVEGASGNTPFLSANDRSRWSTIRSLGDHGTFVLDAVILRPNGKFDKDWHSIDLVRHVGHDGEEHYYSSKPPLLTVLFTGEYLAVRTLTGATLEDKPFYVGRIMLLLTNLALFGLIVLLVALAAEDFGRTDAGRIFVVAAACLGTALTTFGVTLSNHLPAAAAALATLILVLRICEGRLRNPAWFVLAGVTAAMTVVGELPALSIMPFVGLALLRVSPVKTLAAFVPGAALIAAAAIGTNILAHGTYKPAYAQRKDGPVQLTTVLDPASPVVPADVRYKLKLTDSAELTAIGEERWTIWDPETSTRLAVVPAAQAGQYEIRAWGNWYDYPRSYWITPRNGVDRGEASRAKYLFNILLGHHGLFSLTPLWLLTIAGGVLLMRSQDRSLRWTAAVAAALFVICLTFYVTRPLIDRNYGGVSCTFRWLLWQTPLWLVLLIPAADRLLASRWGMIFAAAFLAVSVFSAQYNATNPWRHPWLYDYWDQLGWIESD